MFAAVGANGTPVKVGDAIFALREIVLERSLTLLEIVSTLLDTDVTVFDSVLRFATVA